MAKENFKTILTRSTLFWSMFTTLCLARDSQAIELKWYGVGNITITDEESVLIFDPFVTRPSFWKVITNQQLLPDERLVKETFEHYSKKKNIGIFITHNHFDHILDLPSLMQLLGNPKAVVPRGTARILKGLKTPNSSIELVSEQSHYEVGRFKIKAFQVQHSKLPFNLAFAHGEMPKETSWPLGAFEMKAKNNYAYYISHPRGNILYHPTTQPHHYSIEEVDTLIVGLTSSSITKLNNQVVNKIKHRQLITVHNDNFFKAFKKPVSKMPFLPNWGKELSGSLPKTYYVGLKSQEKLEMNQ